MEIKKEWEGKTLTMRLSGRLDAVTAMQFDKAWKESMEEAKTLIVDMSDLVYVASAGLRSLMMTQKKMDQKGGSMKILHVQPQVMEVFRLTGFDEFLTIEE